MAQKFFESIFGRRKPIIPERGSVVSDFKPIKPARDIADFEYPPESSFYSESSAELYKD